jgi:hypothetical protein
MKINKKNSLKIPPPLSPEWIEKKPLFIIYDLFICKPTFMIDVSKRIKDGHICV